MLEAHNRTFEEASDGSLSLPLEDKSSLQCCSYQAFSERISRTKMIDIVFLGQFLS